MTEFTDLLKQFESEQDESSPDQPKVPILVVDDDPSIRRGLSRVFSHKYDVLTAECGKDAVDTLSEAVHCVILDVKMKEQNGFATYPKLKAKSPNIPIIFYTAFQSEHDLQQVINKFKPEGYVDKGQDITFLDNLVTNAVEKYRLILENEAYSQNLEKKVEERTEELVKTQERERFLDQQLRIRDVLQTTEDVGAQILHENKNLLQPIGNILNRTAHMVRESKKALPVLEQCADQAEDVEGFDKERLQYLADSLEASLGTAEMAYREIIGGYEDFRQVYNPRENGINDIHRDLQASINLIIDRNYRSFIDVKTDFGSDSVPQNYDSRQFNRGIFMNLLKNARDAITEEKAEHSEEYQGKILVKTALAGNQTIVSVHDNGVGVPEGREETIFEKKYSTKESGTGLGLFTAKFILDELNCGRIYCRKSDVPGYTTEMVVELDLQKE
ncbi:MAG: response regulator [Deltaproteobacteria bacterium]|nr:response regulator [Deltaproteobacteria bacterium]